jgi:hypothetical protein
MDYRMLMGGFVYDVFLFFVNELMADLTGQRLFFTLFWFSAGECIHPLSLELLLNPAACSILRLGIRSAFYRR